MSERQIFQSPQDWLDTQLNEIRVSYKYWVEIADLRLAHTEEYKKAAYDYKEEAQEYFQQTAASKQHITDLKAKLSRAVLTAWAMGPIGFLSGYILFKIVM